MSRATEKREKGYLNLRLCCFLFLFSLLLAFPQSPVPAQAQDQRININIASVEELTHLPGIGLTYAARIIEHREKHGPFKRPQDVIVVKGVSAKLYRQIAALIRI